MVDALKTTAPKTAKSTIKPLEWFKFKPELNVRHKGGMNLFGVEVADGYDAGAMASSILSAGRIIEPLTCLEDGTILKGNRRFAGAKLLADDPKTPQEIIKALNEIPVYVHPKSLTSAEIDRIIFDHDRKGMTRAELTTTIWRFYANGASKPELILQFMHPLAEFTGNTRKLSELDSLSESDRDKTVKKWLNGTLANYICAAYDLGSYMQQQFLLQMLVDDRKNREGQKPDFKVDRPRIAELTKIKNNAGDKWHPETATPEFFEKIEEYKKEDAGTVERVRPMTSTELKEQKQRTHSQVGRIAFELAAGGRTDGFEEMDRAAYRTEKIMEVLSAKYDEIKDEKVKELIRSILDQSPEKVGSALAAF